MKKLTLLFLALMTSFSMTFGASGTISGLVSNTPVSSFPPGVLVHFTFYNGTVPGPGARLYDDTVRTDSNGFYSFAYNFVTPSGGGLVVSSITDCRSITVSDSAAWDTATLNSPVINLNYCNTATGCSASFTSSSAGLTVQFNNTSSPILGRVTHSWNFGDGNFSNAISPSHTYAAAGSYAVCLNIFDTLTSCSAAFCDSVTVSVTPPPGRTISGNVATGASAAGTGVVYLITADSNNFLTAVDSALLGNVIGSAYSFNVSPGTYYVKAALSASNPNFSSYLPTYYTNQLSWGSATAVVVTGSSVVANINMVAGVNPGGPGFIGGLVSLGANKVAGPGDPLEGANVILTDDLGNAVAYAVTDANGEYIFPSLAFGTYKLFVDILNKSSVERTITLDANNDKFLDATFVVGENDITTGIADNKVVGLKGLFPNPAKENVQLTLDAVKAGSVQLIITDVLGKEFMNTQLNLAKGTQTLTVNLNDLTEGVYLLNIISDNEIVTEKLVKY